MYASCVYILEHIFFFPREIIFFLEWKKPWIYNRSWILQPSLFSGQIHILSPKRVLLVFPVTFPLFTYFYPTSYSSPNHILLIQILVFTALFKFSHFYSQMNISFLPLSSIYQTEFLFIAHYHYFFLNISSLNQEFPLKV